MRPSPIDLQAHQTRTGLVNEAAPTDILIYDRITDPIMESFGIGISAKTLRLLVAANRGQPLTVHIDSPGGNVFSGIAIFNTLLAHDAPVHVVVDGLAASAASVIAMAGDRITMTKGAWMMIHDVAGGAFGPATELQQMLDLLNQTSDRLAEMYAERAGGDATEWRKRMKDETWLTDREAVALGLADDVGGRAAIQNHFDLSAFGHVPPALTGERTVPIVASSQPEVVTVQTTVAPVCVMGDCEDEAVSAQFPVCALHAQTLFASLTLPPAQTELVTVAEAPPPAPPAPVGPLFRSAIRELLGRSRAPQEGLVR